MTAESSCVTPARVAYLVQHTGLGGAEMLLVSHLLHADRRRYEPVVVVAGEGALSGRLREIGVRVVVLPLDRQASLFGHFSRPCVSTALALARTVREQRCRIIHSYTLDTRNYAHAAGLLTGRPVIHTSQDTWYGDLFGRAQWWAMNRIPRRVIATSDAVSRSLKVGLKLDPRRVRVIRPGIDVAAFADAADAPATRAELGIAAGAPVAGIVARFNAIKGYDVFFAAAAAVARRLPAARFIVVGGPVLAGDTYERRIRALIEQHGLAPHVVLTGFRADVPRLVRAMDVLVSASPSESFGLTLAEAAACGRPAVSTRNGGAQEIVDEGVTGLLVPVGDADALAEATLALLTDPARRAAMGRAARQRAAAHFDIRRMVSDIEAEYDAVLGLRAGCA